MRAAQVYAFGWRPGVAGAAVWPKGLYGSNCHNAVHVSVGRNRALTPAPAAGPIHYGPVVP